MAHIENGSSSEANGLPRNKGAWVPSPKANPFVIGDAPYNHPGPNEVVVKNYAVAVNPIDYMLQDTAFWEVPYPNIFGCDVAGEVVEIGSEITDLSIGQRVIGHAYGMDSGESRQAGFQHYTVLLSQLLCPLPAHVTFAQGAVLPCAISTAAAGMYQESCLHLQLPTIDPKPTGKTLLVWGGASSVGSCAIQLGKASGYEVITTASEYNRAYCKSLGASQVFDYRSPTIRDDIVSALKGKDLVGIYDARSHDDTVQLCVDILLEMKSSKKIITTNPVPAGVSLKGVEALAVLAGTISENFVGTALYHDFLPLALEKGLFKAKPEPLIVGHGLESIQSGVDKVRQGVSAAKVVVTL